MNYRTVVVNGKIGLMEECITDSNHKSAVAFVKGTSKSAKLNTGWRIEMGNVERIVYADCSGDEPQMYYISKGERVNVRLATQADIDTQDNNKAEESETMNEKVNPILVYGKKREDGYIQILHSRDSSVIHVTTWVNGDYHFKDIMSDDDHNVIMTAEMAEQAGIAIDDPAPVRVSYFRFEGHDYEKHLDMIADAEKYGSKTELMAGSYPWLESDQDDNVSHEYIADTIESLRHEHGIEFDVNTAYAIATAQSDEEVHRIMQSYTMLRQPPEQDSEAQKGDGDFMLAYALIGFGNDCGWWQTIDNFMRRYRVINGLPQ